MVGNGRCLMVYDNDTSIGNSRNGKALYDRMELTYNTKQTRWMYGNVQVCTSKLRPVTKRYAALCAHALVRLSVCPSVRPYCGTGVRRSK